jgi:hypothetical protein
MLHEWIAEVKRDCSEDANESAGLARDVMFTQRFGCASVNVRFRPNNISV